MIKLISARTDEIDDAEAAVTGIKTQLDKETLLRHSVGIISCHADFVSQGVVKALAEALPFPLAGATTIAAASPEGQGEFWLVLTVLTGDDVEFMAAVTDPITEENDTPFRSSWEKTGKQRADKPVLMLSFAPLLLNVSGDFFAESWTAITGNVPNFGTVAVDHNQDYHEAQTIFNGEAWRDRYVFVLIYGNISPRFFIGGISGKKAFLEKGVVTASRGNQLQSVNNIPVAEYLGGLGLTRDETGNIVGINAYPFIVDYNDGTQPIVRIMFATTPDGSAVCGGKVPVGAHLMVGAIDADDVLETTQGALKAALSAAENGKSLLIFSCIGRYFVQGFNNKAEMEKTRSILGDRPFHFGYSGTELCPVYGKEEKSVNRSHNDTIVICVL